MANRWTIPLRSKPAIERCITAVDSGQSAVLAVKVPDLIAVERARLGRQVSG